MAAFAALALTNPGAAQGLASQLAPVLGFAAGMSAMVNLAAREGVFTYLASRIEGTRYTWACFLALSVLVTVFLSLDTTALMLTPLAVALARRNGLSTTALALSVVWVANLSSLMLPVSNLTNLMALRFFAGPYDFLAASWAPALAGIGVAVVASYCARAYWPAGKPTAPGRNVPAPRAALAVVGLTVCALLTPLPFWLTAAASAVAMAAIAGPISLRGLIPWQALCLVVVVSSAAAFLPDVSFPPDAHPLCVALAGAVGANLINNLPAYLLLEDPNASLPLLVGVNFGPLVTPWASLATLLWHDQLRRAGVDLPWRTFVCCGAVLAPVAVAAGVVAIR